jgi:hypothetical protein
MEGKSIHRQELNIFNLRKKKRILPKKILRTRMPTTSTPQKLSS